MSFATPIMTGIAANAWLSQPGANATQLLADIKAAARAGARPDAQG